MSDLTDAARPAVTSLLPLDEDELYRELGGRLRMIARNPDKADSFDVQIEVSPFETRTEDLARVGRLFFQNLSLSAYNVVCGSADGSQQVKEAVNKGVDTLAVTVTAVLVANLGLAAAVATTVAVIIVKSFANAATGTLCEVWKGSVSKPSEPGTPSAG